MKRFVFLITLALWARAQYTPPNVGGGSSLTQTGATVSVASAGVATQENTVLWADQFTGTDIGAKINAAIAACPTTTNVSFTGPTGCTIEIPAGAFQISTGININKDHMCVEGAGVGATIFVVTGTFTGPAITVNQPDEVPMCLRNFAIEAGGWTSTNQTAISLSHIYSGDISNIRIIGNGSGTGLNGIVLVTNIAQTNFDHIYMDQITGTALDIEGDSSGTGENKFHHIEVLMSATASSTGACILYNRTTVTDFGGEYFSDTICAGRTGAGSGLKATNSNAAGGWGGLFLTNFISDGFAGNDSVLLNNVSNIYCTNCWMVNNGPGASNLAGLHISGASSIIEVTNSIVSSNSRGVSLTGGVQAVSISGTYFQDGSATNDIFLDAVGTKSNINFANNTYLAPTLTNDASQLSSIGRAYTAPTFTSGLSIWTNAAAGGTIASLAICDKEVGATNPCQFIRSQNGVIQFLDNAFDGNLPMSITNAGVLTTFGSHQPFTAGVGTNGTNALPWSSFFFGGAATNNWQLTGTATGARTFTASETARAVMGNASATAASNISMGTTVDVLGYQTAEIPAYVSVCSGGGTGCGGTPGDFTTSGSGTALEAITGLSWTFPANTALNISFSCHLIYHQNVAAAGVTFGFQDATVAPTQFNGKVEAYTSATAFTAANLVASSTTTATAVTGTVTPSAITTNWNADFDGRIEQPSNASSSLWTINVSTLTAADTVVIKRGSFCHIG